MHDVIQIAFGWRGSHLHAFLSADGRRWADARWADERPVDEEEDGDDRSVTLAEVLDEDSGPLKYEYDFGDGWIHQIELIETIFGGTSPAAVLMRGERRGPLEDSGGIHGYTEKLQILSSPDDPDYEDLRDWVDGTSGPWQVPFDPEALEVDRSTERLPAASKGTAPGLAGVRR